MSATLLRCSLGDLPVLSGGHVVSLRGNWSGSVVCHLPEGAAALPELEAAALVFTREDGGEDVFSGAVRRSGADTGRERLTCTVVGGAGKLLRDVGPRDHAPGAMEIPAGLIARGICDDAGEQLVDELEAALDQRSVPRWTRIDMPGRDALDLLADVLGYGWRVLPSGRVWLGEETWPELGTEAASRLHQVPEDGAEVWRTDGAPLVPGVTLGGLQVVEVTYNLDAGQSRATVRAAVAGDPPRAPRVEMYERTYAATVVAQAAGGGPLEVIPDDPRLGNRDHPIRGVPLRCGIPGARITYATPAGERVRLAFESADPRSIYALPAHDQAPAGTTMRRVARRGDPVVIGTLSATVMVDGAPVAAQLTFTPDPFTGATGATSDTVQLVAVIAGGSLEVQIR